MLPHLEQMAGELGDQVKMVKFNCSKENKELGKQLGIRVAPTFHLYKNSDKVRTAARSHDLLVHNLLARCAAACQRCPPQAR